MTSIDAAFDDLVTLLAGSTLTLEGTPVAVGNVTAFASSPADPPFLQVGPSEDDYITFDDPGLTFGSATLHGSVLFAVPAADNDVEVGYLHDLLVQVIQAISDSNDWMVSRVTRPGEVPVNGQSYLGVTVEVIRQIDL